MGEAVHKLLLAVLADNDEEAELAISQLKVEDEKKLIDFIQIPNMDLKWWAIRGLAQIGTSDSVQMLIESLSDAQADIRGVAALSLAYIHKREPLAVQPTLTKIAQLLSDVDGVVRQTAADALSMCGEDAVDSLAIALNHQQDAVRVRAAYALRKISTMRTAPHFYQHLNDPNYLVRMYAYEALDEMGLLENVLVAV